VRGDGLMNRINQDFLRPGEIAETDDLSGVEQALYMFLQTENGGTAFGRVAADAFKNAKAVMQAGIHGRNCGICRVFQLVIKPDVFCECCHKDLKFDCYVKSNVGRASSASSSKLRSAPVQCFYNSERYGYWSKESRSHRCRFKSGYWESYRRGVCRGRMPRGHLCANQTQSDCARGINPETIQDRSVGSSCGCNRCRRRAPFCRS